MSKGIVRAIDKMGRVVIPKELREQLGVKNEIDSFDIYQDGDKIILEKYRPSCVFCNKIGASVKLGEYRVCKNCIDKLNKAIEEVK